MSRTQAFNEYTPPPFSVERPDPGYVRADDRAEAAVTIVTPYHNAGEVFRDTATSIMRQTL